MKRIGILVLIILLLLSACTPAEEPPRLQITATVYPTAMAAKAVCAGVPGVRVDQMVADAGACVHDYNLSVRDLQKLENADLLILSGAGLESFLEGLLSRYPDLTICDSSEGLELLCPESDHGHEEHDHGHAHAHESDPHLWMDPMLFAEQTEAIAEALAQADPDYAPFYRRNAQEFVETLQAADETMSQLLESVSCRDLITFHEGFGYFARRYGFHVTGIEEEAGGEASAKVLITLAQKIREEGIPAVFYEENGSDRSARVLSRECGIPALPLSMLMDGDGTPEGFIDTMLQNARTIAEVYAQ